ncbi:DUF4292 domain-containing protein [bacterium]|nr:DUF4292 domain-containing protein [bacterium]
MNRAAPCFRLLYAVCVLIMLPGCAPRGIRPLRESSPAVLFAGLQEQSRRLQTFQGFAQVTVSSEEGTYTGYLQIAARDPDSLWMKAEGTLGMDILTLRLSGREALCYSPWLNMAIRGRLDAVKRLPPVQHTGVAFLFEGRFGFPLPPMPLLDSLDRMEAEERNIRMQFRTGDRIWISPDGPCVTRWERRDRGGNLLWSWQGDKFKRFGDVRLPRIVRIITADPARQVTLVFRKIKANARMKKGWADLPIPEGVQTIEFRQDP